MLTDIFDFMGLSCVGEYINLLVLSAKRVRLQNSDLALIYEMWGYGEHLKAGST
jgi:hypothetical protein